MTSDQKTELEYLIDLLREASKWNVDQGDDAVRLEIDLRINNILSSVEVDGEPEDPPESNEHLVSPEKVDNARSRSQSKWESSKVRCSENGRLVWRPRAECVKVPRDTSKGGPKWKWQWMGPKDKQEQCDAMWNEHEAGNAE